MEDAVRTLSRQNTQTKKGWKMQNEELSDDLLLTETVKLY